MPKKGYVRSENYKKQQQEYNKRYYAKTRNAANRNQRYTIEEINMIMEHSIPDAELSKLIGRSVMAIQIKRAKWGGAK